MSSRLGILNKVVSGVLGKTRPLTKCGSRKVPEPSPYALIHLISNPPGRDKYVDRSVHLMIVFPNYHVSGDSTITKYHSRSDTRGFDWPSEKT